ncbi:hypothetical protein [Streptomyces cahuitamycinicus]|uniref:hypothetical protein n=1 Tax=Streptomyces cahuitamycinicus TaxID=2070367 RepID=UPI0011AF3735|nr:hypothetical protein [Streptomyces cahuitamycinicus]
MSGDVAEPMEARPWRPENGAKPLVRTWPHRDPPALWVWSKGRWRWATVMARQDWPDGRIAYQVRVDLDGSTCVRARTYWWPHPGLRVAHRSAYPSSTGPVEGGDLPLPLRRPPR